MIDRDALMDDLTEDVDRLTEPRRHLEPYETWANRRHRRRWHLTDQPSLLAQLHAAVTLGTADQVNGTAVPGSRPPLSVEVLDRLMAVDAGAVTWVTWRLRLDLRADTPGNLRAMVGAAPTLDHPGLLSMVADVRRWRLWASTLTGWERPAYRPWVPCPLCARRNGLIIHLDRRTACCVHCGEAWDEHTIGLLAEHILAYGDRLTSADVDNVSVSGETLGKSTLAETAEAVGTGA